MKMRFVIILLLLLVVQNVKSQESLVEQHETNINNIVEQCRILYPFDETKDKLEEIQIKDIFVSESKLFLDVFHRFWRGRSGQCENWRIWL